MATIRAPLEDDAEEWYSALQDFIEGRFDVEPVDTSRVLRELIKTARDLSTYGLV